MRSHCLSAGRQKAQKASHSFVEYDRNMCYNKRLTGDQHTVLRKSLQKKQTNDANTTKNPNSNNKTKIKKERKLKMKNSSINSHFTN